MSKHNIFSLVSDHFDGDNAKTYRWFNEIHPFFGLTPLSMMRKGQTGKLLKHVLDQLDEGKL